MMILVRVSTSVAGRRGNLPHNDMGMTEPEQYNFIARNSVGSLGLNARFDRSCTRYCLKQIDLFRAPQARHGKVQSVGNGHYLFFRGCNAAAARLRGSLRARRRMAICGIAL